MSKGQYPPTTSASDSRLETRAREHELKVITDRISMVEKNYTALSKDITSYNTALEGLKDKGLRLSMSLEAYAEQEFPSVRNSAQGISECIASVQDYIGAEVDFLLSKVAQPLSLYSTNCKHARDYIKETTTLRDKEQSKLKVLDKMKTKDPNNRSKLSQLEQELQKASVDSRRSRQTMVEQMVTFEKKKIDDFKKSFGNFFHGQLLFHAKALEIYTQAYKSVIAIDEGQDLEAFENLVHPSNIPPSLDSMGRSASQTSLQYGSQGSLLGSQHSLNRTSQSLQSQGSLNE